MYLDQYAKKSTYRRREKIRWVNHNDSENNITKRAVYEICINPYKSKRGSAADWQAFWQPPDKCLLKVECHQSTQTLKQMSFHDSQKNCHRLVTSSCLRTLIQCIHTYKAILKGKNTNDPEPNEKEFTMKTSLILWKSKESK